MEQNKLNQIIELENKFKELVEIGHPYVIDNGFFIDAVFNVTTQLKKQIKEVEYNPDKTVGSYHKGVSILDNLYKSLKEFEALYTSCLHKEI